MDTILIIQYKYEGIDVKDSAKIEENILSRLTHKA